MAERSVRLIQLFENALIYTAVGDQVSSIIRPNDESAIITVISFSVILFLLQLVEGAVAEMWPNPNHIKKPIKDLMIFITETASNIAVQMVSTLAARTLTQAVENAESTLWAILGAFAAITLLWLLSRIVMRKPMDEMIDKSA